MFLLSETELAVSTPLKTISRIDIAFYKSRNESINIFNLEWDFTEDIIPLITSILECKPVLTNRKKYIGLDSNYIIELPVECNNKQEMNLGAYCFQNSKFPSFYQDIETFNTSMSKCQSQNKKSYWQSRKLHYTNVYAKSQELVRVYSREESIVEKNKIFNPQDTFGCKEELVISWNTDWGAFELIIMRGERKCIWHLVVNVTEDNNFIDSKVDAVNTWLEKIHKIKSTITIAN